MRYGLIRKNAMGAGLAWILDQWGVFERVEEKCFVNDPDECLVCRACEVQCLNAVIEAIE